jgi:hypothetical protein
MEEPQEDDLLRERAFQRARGLDLSGFALNVQDEPAPEEDVQPEPEDVDAAIGDVYSPFGAPSENDGPSDDVVTGIAVEGERRLGQGLLVAMVVAYSALAAYVGTALPPAIAAPGLLILGTVGLWLGERWIPRPSMRLLGVTWVIISMKILYGFALDAHHWGWYDALPDAGLGLGVTLLALVGLNVALAQRHNDDAIAAQATLILLLVGSAAGGLYGEFGVVLMIAFGTMVLHGMALLRGTGNLASLGIAASYLWVGVHALSDDWVVLGLHLVPLEDGLLTFLLMATITGMNAVMATRFSQHENWFSSALEALGVGRPGLWAVSVGLGMVGATLSVAANREDVGYALAQVALLLTAFSGSYLAVRGVAWASLQAWVLWLPSLLTLALIPLVTLEVNAGGWSVYALHAALMVVCTSVVILRNEANVSDHVLWVGSIALVVLLTLLVPAGGEDAGQALLVGGVLTVWTGLAWLALRRDAPSLAGTAVLSPWVWAMLFVGDFDDRLLSSDIVSIELTGQLLGAFLAGSLLITYVVNLQLGDTGVNLGRNFTGGTELSARLRDAGSLDLWTAGSALALLTVLVSLIGEGLPLEIGLLLMVVPVLVEASVAALGGRRHHPRRTLTLTGIASLMVVWNLGHASVFAAALLLSIVVLMADAARRRERVENLDELADMDVDEGGMHALLLGFLMLIALVRWLQPQSGTLDGLDLSSDAGGLGLITGLALALFVRREVLSGRLITNVLTALGLLVAMLLVSFEAALLWLQGALGLMFVLTGGWLSIQGEMRSALKTTARIEQRREEHAEVEARRAAFVERLGHSDGSTMHRLDNSVQGASLDVANAAALRRTAERSTARRPKVRTSDETLDGLEHRPTVLMAFIGATSLSGAIAAWLGVNHALTLAMTALLVTSFIGLARWSADRLEMPLPQVLGIDAPVAVGLAGLLLVEITGRVGGFVVLLGDQVHVLAFVVGAVLVASMHVLGRDQLGLRLPAFADALLWTLVAGRVVTLFIGGEVPVPLQIDPFEGEPMAWVLPLFFLEAVLIALVLLHEWVEGVRRRRDLPDQRGAGGRAMTALLPVALSFGPAGLLALLLGLRRGIMWRQPAVPLLAGIALPVAWASLVFWLDPALGLTLPGLIPAALFMGGVSLAVAGWTVVREQPLWLAAALQGSHVLLIPAAWSGFGLTGAVVALLVLSGGSWVIGILVLRRSWRVIGLADLLGAWTGFGMALIAGAPANTVLVMLVITVALLSIVTWLTQRDADEIAVD